MICLLDQKPVPYDSPARFGKYNSPARPGNLWFGFWIRILRFEHWIRIHDPPFGFDSLWFTSWILMIRHRELDPYDSSTGSGHNDSPAGFGSLWFVLWIYNPMIRQLNPNSYNSYSGFGSLWVVLWIRIPMISRGIRIPMVFPLGLDPYGSSAGAGSLWYILCGQFPIIHPVDPDPYDAHLHLLYFLLHKMRISQWITLYVWKVYYSRLRE